MKLNQGYAYTEQLGKKAAGLTLLDYLSRFYTHSTLEDWQQRLIREEIELDGQTVSGNPELKPGQALVWHRPPWEEPEVPLDFTVVHEDEHLLAINKPSGLPTMPAGGFLEHTLLMQVRKNRSEASPLHRLGRYTSGIVLFARTAEGASLMAKAWRDHEVQKRYLAVASGQAPEELYQISTPIGPVLHPRLGSVFAASPDGKPSYSLARVLERIRNATLFQVDIQTGRPHQIRIHLASIGHPLVGDPLYGPDGLPLKENPGLPGDGGYRLHAARLVFQHPISAEQVDLQAPLPEGFWSK
ncbi:RluA family pseudouridine synthase [Deinococcus cellulosilyticus]|uniref:Pseudouridine synthase n=1 Tax=Deinococcus cellulosilyticus (strain DSM 18568 / NBRC 106333 / KACC 11606 / 5516J-15) TaxID=1223518 RepID=A0A511MVY9_DEIC1|nr:RluA family pseudouridine synthase [Deinococcus cellulosilyticus]GEM44742.1 RNA pseudouridine synthase [Deinococcus cellulosilyticus NBRC 106333 = KACC 11606]